MSDLILHHYPVSPFSEKVRLVFGLKGLPWKSVVIPSIMPKPDVVALTGGYRKTPFLQIGSDVYCDSALICEVLDGIAPNPSLYPDSSKGLARIIAQWADSTLFWAAMAHNLSPQGAAAMFANAPPEAAKAFGADRAAMSAGMNRLRPADADGLCESVLEPQHLPPLETRCRGYRDSPGRDGQLPSYPSLGVTQEAACRRA